MLSNFCVCIYKKNMPIMQRQTCEILEITERVSGEISCGFPLSRIVLDLKF